MMTKYNFLCADIGTTSLKAALVSQSGQVLSFSQIEFKTDKSLSISKQWSDAFSQAVLQIRKSLDINENLNCDAICISGNGPTIVSEDGTTLLWNEQLAFVPKIPQEFQASLFLPRIVSFKNLYKSKFESQKIFSGPEYLIWCLSNSFITILPESRYQNAYWTQESLKSIGANPSHFGKFVNPGFDCGFIKMEVAKKLKISPNAKIIAGGPDFIVALIGTNTLTPGKICNRAGSSEGINWCTDKPVFAQGIRTLPSIISNLWNASILSNTSGKKISDCKLNFERENKIQLSFEEYINFCLEQKDENGLKVLNEVAQFSRDGLKTIITLAKENKIPIDKTVMVTGGQAKSKIWLQYKANFSNYNFATTKVPDSELIGDAVLASYGLGLYNSIQDAAKKIVIQEQVFVPQTKKA